MDATPVSARRRLRSDRRLHLEGQPELVGDPSQGERLHALSRF